MAGYWPSLNIFVDWDEVDFNKSTEKNQVNILTKQVWLIRDLLPYMAKNRTFSSGTKNPERPILPTQGGGGASLPSFFFSSWIFVSRSTIWTRGTGYTKGHKKIEQWKHILYHANNNAQMMLYNAQMTT